MFIVIERWPHALYKIYHMKYTYIIAVLIPALFIGCRNNQGSSDNGNNSASGYSSTHDENNDGYPDGTYCASVEYYYSETGTQSTYTLKVDIEDNELVKIYWPNGGWLDNSHFTPPDISDGTVTFTSDRGVDYTIHILGEEGDCTLSGYADDEDDLIQQQEERKEEEAEMERQREEREQKEQERMEEERRAREEEIGEQQEREQEEREQSEQEPQRFN